MTTAASREFIFRPTILIFAGDAPLSMRNGSMRPTGDETIYDHFCDFCASMDELLFEAVAVIHVDDAQQAMLHPIVVRNRKRWPFALDGHDEAAGPRTFSEVFTDALRRVQSERCRQRITTSRIGLGRYEIPNVRPQIFVVGPTDSPLIHTLATQVDDALARRDLRTFLGYVLFAVDDSLPPQPAMPFNIAFDPADPLAGPPPGVPPVATPATAASPPSWRDDLRAQHGEFPLVNFCLMYEDMHGGPNPTTLFPADVRYSMAEALFSLIATPLTHSGAVERAVERGLSIAHADARTGTLSTSLIRFPRAEAERYSACMLSADIIEHWKNQSGTPVSKGALNQALRDARARAARVRQAMRDEPGHERPGTEPARDGTTYLWPNLRSLAKDPRAQQDQGVLEDLSARLFGRFHEDAFLDPDSLDRLQVLQTFTAAAEDYRQWRDTAQGVWKNAGAVLRQGLWAHVDDLWLRPGGSIRVASAYIAQLDKLLTDLGNDLKDLRSRHEQRYFGGGARPGYLPRIRAKARRGPWRVTRQSAGLGGNTTTTPITPSGATIAGGPGWSAVHPATGQPLAPPVAVGGLGAPPGAPPSGAPTRPLGAAPQPLRSDDEDEILANLIARMQYRRRSMPEAPSLIAAGVMAGPALLLLAASLLPASVMLQPLWALVGLVLVAGLMVAASFAVAAALGHRAKVARHDVLEFLTHFFAHRSEHWEDLLRAATVNRLSRTVKKIRDRLDHVDAFLQSLADRLRATAQETESQLLRETASYRDVFVGNGTLLQWPPEGPKVGLDSLHQEVERLRKTHPQAENHRSIEGMSAILRQSLLQRRAAGPVLGDEEQASILAIPPEAIEELITTFAFDVNLPYLQGEIASIGHALQVDAEGVIWRRALERSEGLYRSLSRPEPFTYIAGRDEERRTLRAGLIPAHTEALSTRRDDWLMVGRFWPGGGHARPPRASSRPPADPPRPPTPWP